MNYKNSLRLIIIMKSICLKSKARENFFPLQIFIFFHFFPNTFHSRVLTIDFHFVLFNFNLFFLIFRIQIWCSVLFRDRHKKIWSATHFLFHIQEKSSFRKTGKQWTLGLIGLAYRIDQIQSSSNGSSRYFLLFLSFESSISARQQ